MCFKTILLFCTIISVRGFIIPEELPSVLSLIYSNIPPIKKGTDSRFGVGFRLGEHADFQVLVELGPQTNTRPLGGSSGTTSKRNTDNHKDKLTNTDGGKWLSNWKEQMSNEKPDLPASAPGFSSESQPQTSFENPYIPLEALTQLQKLYGKTTPDSSSDGVRSLPAIVETNSQATNQALPETKKVTQKEKQKIYQDLSDVELE